MYRTRPTCRWSGSAGGCTTSLFATSTSSIPSPKLCDSWISIATARPPLRICQRGFDRLFVPAPSKSQDLRIFSDDKRPLFPPSYPRHLLCFSHHESRHQPLHFRRRAPPLRFVPIPPTLKETPQIPHTRLVFLIPTQHSSSTTRGLL